MRIARFVRTVSSLFPTLKQGCVWLLTILLCTLPRVRAEERPRLNAILKAAEGAIRLELHGSTGATCVIEASLDLRNWASIGSGTATNGFFALEQSLALQGPHRFFRGRDSSGPGGGDFPGSVTLGLDTDHAVSLLTLTNGGSAVLYAPDGTRFKFTLPPLTLPEAVVMTMSLVTNVGGLPFSGGMVGAVRLEPDHLPLWGAGTLEITLPPELDRRKIVSFAADGDGSSFHLTPDRVATDGVVIPVTRLGLFGSALALATELPTNKTASSRSQNSIRSSRSKARLQDTAECFPDETTDAEFFDETITEFSRQSSQEIAAALAAARQAQLAGTAEDTFDFQQALERAEVDQCSLIQGVIGPLLQDATRNCALSRVLLAHLLGIERQRQLLGIPENSQCPSALSQLPVCAMMKNCVQEIQECCNRGNRGRQRVIAIYEIVRQDQLLGGDCLTQGEIDDAVEACTPGQWVGRLNLRITGEESESDPNSGRSESDKLTEEFQGEVTESSELGGGGFTFINLTVEGQLASRYESTLILTGGIDCGGFFSYDHESDIVSGAAVFQVAITVTPTAPPSVIVTPIPEPVIRGTRSSHSYSRNGYYVLGDRGKECRVNQESDSDSDTFQYVTAAAIFGEPATLSGNTISGSASLKRTQLRLDGSGSFDWTFERRPNRP